MKARPIGIIGNLNVDMVVGPTDAPQWEREVLAGDIQLRIAGTAGYLALAAKALGMEPRVVSALGRGPLIRTVLDDLQAAGVDVAGIRILHDAADPVTIALVGHDGRRALVTVLGAHERITPDLYEEMAHLLSPAAELFICGTYLLPGLGPRAARDVARRAKAHGQDVAFDPSWDPAGWPEETRRGTLDLLAYVDVFLPNQEELCALMGITPWQEAARALARIYPGELIIKRGPAGSAAPVTGQLYQVPGLPIEPQDTTGAGDVFDAAYLWARRHNFTIPERLALANTMAAMVVAQTGTRTYPPPAEVLERCRAHYGTMAPRLHQMRPTQVHNEGPA